MFRNILSSHTEGHALFDAALAILLVFAAALPPAALASSVWAPGPSIVASTK